jgi:hypothetical protein
LIEIFVNMQIAFFNWVQFVEISEIGYDSCNGCIS